MEATDVDSETLSDWTILSGNEEGIFTIDSSTGEITIADHTNLDYESTTTYSLEVTVSDGTDTSEETIVTININDIADTPTVSFSSSESSGDESVGSIELQVNLSYSEGYDVSVDYTVQGTATEGEDYTLEDGTLTISAGSTSGTITIADIVDDKLSEEDETVVVTLSNLVNAVEGENMEYTYTILDNDVEIYEGFSPNGDGTNDYYVIPWLDRYTQVGLQVFSRW